jgi:starvation-inducible DNA-binding protein
MITLEYSKTRFNKIERTNMLKDDLKTLLGTTFTFYVKIHGFHFNVEGPDFPQYHKFLSDFYSDVYGSIDKIGEYIRTLDAYAPGSLSRYIELSAIQDQTQIPRAELMFIELKTDNDIMLKVLDGVFKTASNENKQGIANFIAERLDAHEKWNWMLRSILNKARA